MRKIKRIDGFKPMDWNPKCSCYDYAINYPEPINYVGELSGFSGDIKSLTNEELFERLFCDMECLGIKIRKAKYNTKCRKREWKIAVFVEEGDYDYHFMREDSHNSWSHKFRDEYPKRTDLIGRIITDPRKAAIWKYEFVCFFILKV